MALGFFEGRRRGICNRILVRHFPAGAVNTNLKIPRTSDTTVIKWNPPYPGGLTPYSCFEMGMESGAGNRHRGRPRRGRHPGPAGRGAPAASAQHRAGPGPTPEALAAPEAVNAIDGIDNPGERNPPAGRSRRRLRAGHRLCVPEHGLQPPRTHAGGLGGTVGRTLRIERR